MKQYIKPESTEITLMTEGNLLLPSGAKNHKWQSDETQDSDYGQQFSKKKGWDSSLWSDNEE